MKSIKFATVFTLLIISGMVRADWGDSRLVTRVTDQVTDLLSSAQDSAGSISNIAINTNDVNARVTVEGSYIRFSGTPAEVEVNVNQRLEAKQINIQNDGDQTTRVNNRNASQVNLATTNTANAMSSVSDNISAIALANSIDATAVGAMNSVAVSGFTGTDHRDTQTPGVANLAINTADVSSRVRLEAIEGISIRNTSITATALGAVNTGSIAISSPISSGR